MTCAKICELLTDYVMGELPQDLNIVVNEHLQCCAACRNEHLALKKITSELQEMAHCIEPPEYLSNQLEKALLTEISCSEQKNKWWRPKFVIPIAATFLIMAVGLGIWGNQLDSNKESVKNESPAAVVLEQVEQPDKEKETVVQDTQLQQPSGSTEPMSGAVKMQTKSAHETEPEQITLKAVTEPDAPSETQSVEILRTVETDDADQGFTIAQTQTIVLDTVQQVNIKETNEQEQEQVINRQDNIEAIAMIVEGINNALPSEIDTIEKNDITHMITIQLDNGDNYQLNYCLTENIGFGEKILNGQVIHPGEGLSLALQSL